jgi:ATP-dependent helicase/nuclease subunit A
VSGPRLTDAQRRALHPGRSTSVTAGAGSGKTTVLVERYVALLRGDGERAPLAPSEVLAFTFTQKAAREMRQRVLARVTADPALRDRRRRLTEELLDAPIATIHGWCARVLREHAVACGLDPAFEVIEELDARGLLDESVADLLNDRAARSDADADVRALARLWRRSPLARELTGLYRSHRLRVLAWARSTAHARAEAVLARWTAYGTPDPRPLVAQALGGALSTAASAAGGVADDDKLLHALRQATGLRDDVAGAPSPREARRRLRLGWLRADLLARRDGGARSFGRTGAVKRWPDRATLDQARDAVGRFAEGVALAASTTVACLDERAIAPLGELARLVLDLDRRYRAAKRARAALDFDDLIELTERLVTGGFGAPAARRVVRPYRCVLVDEFQDVDERQARIALAVASGGATAAGDGGAPAGRDALAGGRLFVVGDDKQSIYRFRGADVTVFRELRERIARAESDADGAGVSLRDCFRTLPAPLAVVNAAFEQLFAAGPAARQPFEAEPAALIGQRGGEGAGSAELLLLQGAGAGAGDTTDGGDTSLAAELDEAELVARYLARRLRAGATMVARREADGSVHPTPLREEDVAILLRSRTHLKLYESALRRHGIAFAVHGGLGFWSAPEVTDVVGLLTFLADPGDDLALAAVLRSPLALLPDDALYAVARLGPASTTLPFWERFGAAATGAGLLPLAPDDRAAVERAHARLTDLAARCHRAPVAELVRGALEASGAVTAYAVGPRGGRALANLEKLLDILRDLERRTPHGLGELAALLAELSDEDAREGEAEVEGARERGVRILTVHASKGLEFPLVIVPGTGRRPGNDRSHLTLEELGGRDPDGAPLYELGLRMPDPERDGAPAPTGLRTLLAARAASKAEAESKRLLYVALTRARDHLVIAGRLGAGGRPAGGTWLAWLCDALGADASAITAGGLEVVPPEGPPARWGIVTEASLADTAADAGVAGARVFALLGDAGAETPQPRAPGRSGQRPAAPPRPLLSPSRWKHFRGCPRRYWYRLVLGLEEEPVRLGGAEGDGDPGIAMARGTAIHRLLELDRLQSDDLDAEVRRVLAERGQAGNAALLEETARAARRAADGLRESALAREIVAARGAWREAPFCMRLGAGEVEGTIDLLFEGADGGWRVVDWKTDVVDDTTPLEDHARDRGYTLQLDLYALAAAELLGLGAGVTEGPDVRVRAGLFFTWRGEEVVRAYTRADLAEVRDRAAADLAEIAQGRFGRGAAAPCAQCGFARPLAGDATPLCDVAELPQRRLP